MTDFSMRRLASEEVALAKQLFAVFRRAFAAENDDAVQQTLPSDEYLARLLAKEDFYVIVAVQDGVIVGGITAYELMMSHAETRELFIYDVAVAVEHRRQGIGSALLRFAKELCQSRGISALYVAAHADDAPAVQLYTATLAKREDVAWFVQEF